MLQRTGKAWDAYYAEATASGDSTDTRSRRCEELWDEFRECLLKFMTARENRT